jgi:hypothetical protein
MRKPFAILLVFGVLVSSATEVAAQEIPFGSFYTGAPISLFTIRDLDFGTIVAGDTKERQLGSGDEAVIELEGIPYLDVVVSVTAPDYVYLNGDDLCVLPACRLPLTLNYAFTNNLELVDQIGAAIPFPSGTARFPIQRRVTGPPMPPPDPSITLVSFPSATSYIYIYGSVTSIIGSTSGDYQSTITVTVEYF